MRDLSLFSAVASCSSGVELDQAQIVVVGNARGHGGNYRVGHSVMKDALDQDGIWDGHPRRRPRAARAPALHRPRRPPGQRLPQVRGRPDRQGARPAQRDARRLRRLLAPPDQGDRRRRDRVGDRRPGRLRVGGRGAPGPVRRRPGRRDRQGVARPRGSGPAARGSRGHGATRNGPRGRRTPTSGAGGRPTGSGAVTSSRVRRPDRHGNRWPGTAPPGRPGTTKR